MSFSKPELHSWLHSSGSVFSIASFGKTLAEITLLVVMTKHRALSYPLAVFNFSWVKSNGAPFGGSSSIWEYFQIILRGDTHLHSSLCGAVQLCLLDCAWAYSWGILCVTGKKHNCGEFEYLFVSTVMTQMEQSLFQEASRLKSSEESH